MCLIGNKKGDERPITGRRWRSPSHAVCARSWPTATSGLGKLYQRTGKRQEAHKHLTAATTMYREMDMRFWLSRRSSSLTAFDGRA